MNNDLRQQILVSLRAEGVGEADKAREAIAHVSAEVQRVTKSFIDGTTEAAQFKKEVTALGGQLKFFGDIVQATEQQVGAIDVGLHKLQVTALKFGDDYQAAMAKAAQAAEDLAIKEAEAFAKAIATHEAFLAKSAADDEAEATKKADLLAREIAAEIAAADKEAALAAEAVQQEERRFNRMMADRQAYLAKAAAADAAAALKEEQRTDKLLADHEAKEAKEAAAAEASAVKKADILAREVAAELAAAAKIEAANADAVMKEEQRFNRMMADRQKYLDQQVRAEIEAATAGMVPLSQLQNSGLEFQETLRKTNLEIAKGKKGFDAGAEAANKFGYGMLHAAHGLQDLQYGFAAFLNNIPLIVQSAGAGPGLAGTLMLVGVGLELLKPKIIETGESIKRIATHFSTAVDPAKKMGETVQGLEEKLESLNKKPNKVALDYFQIEQAEKKLSDLERKLESFNSHVNDATPLQEKVAAEVDTVISEFSGGSDSKSGTQNLLDIIESARRNRGNTKLGGEFFTGQEGFEKYAQRVSVREGIMGRQAKGEFLWGEDAQLKQVNKDIAELEQRMTKGARDKIKATIEDARAGVDAGIRVIANEFGRKPDAFLKPGGGLAPVDPEFANMLEQARGPNIQAREEEDAAEKRAESMRETDNFLRKRRRERAKAAEKIAEKSREMVAKFEAPALGDEALKDQQTAKTKKETKEAKDAREHAQAIGQQVNRFDGEFAKQKGPGSLTEAILGRVKAGQSNADIVQGMKGQVKGRLGDVPANLADEVAAKILEDAVGKVRAEIAGRGGGKVGLNAAIGERADKLDRAADAAANRQGRQQAGALEAGMAQEIFQQAGGQLNEAGAMRAAHRAMQAMRDGTNQQQAMWQGMMATLEDVAADAMRTQMQLNGIHGRINGLQGQVRRNRAQRPGLLPQFPQ